MSASDRLDEIQARTASATYGPWAAHDFGYSGQDEPSSIVVHRGKFDWQAICDGEFIASMPTWDRQESDDAAFIAAARTDVPGLVSALRAVLALHFDDGGVCGDCDLMNYPCPTVSAIESALVGAL